MQNYWIYHHYRYEKPNTVVSIDLHPEQMSRLIYYLLILYKDREELLYSHGRLFEPRWMDNEGILSEQIIEILQHYNVSLSSKEEVDSFHEIDLYMLWECPSKFFPSRIDHVGSACFTGIDMLQSLAKDFWVEGLGETIHAIACRRSIPNLAEVGPIKSSIRDWRFSDDPF